MRLTTSIRKAYVTAAMDDVPMTDYREEIRKLAQAAAISVLPASVQKVAGDKSAAEHLRDSWIYFDGQSVTVHGRIEKKDLSKADLAALDKLCELKKSQDKARIDLSSKLEFAAAACNTSKALAELLPEFAKYLPPEDDKARNLPVVAGVVDAFAAAGWPKAQVKKVRAARVLK